MRDFLTALALVLVIEGSLYALFPDTMKRVMMEALKLPSGMLRNAGLAVAVFGVALAWAIRG